MCGRYGVCAVGLVCRPSGTHRGTGFASVPRTNQPWEPPGVEAGMSTATTDTIAPVYTAPQPADRRIKPRGYVRIDRRRNARMAMSEAARQAHVEDWLNGRAPLVTPAGNSSVLYRALKRAADI